MREKRENADSGFDSGKERPERRWLVVTWIHEKQVGLLDTRYRTSAMFEHFNADIVTNSRGAIDELGVPSSKVICLEAPRGGLRSTLGYVRAVRDLCVERGITHVLLLHSALAMFAPILRSYERVLYWNEHPTHLYPSFSGGVVAWTKSTKNALFRSLAYRGARSVEVVMPIGEYQEEELLEKGVDPDRVRLVYMGVDDQFSASTEEAVVRRAEGDILRVIYAGSVQKERGRDIMVEALALANRDRRRAHLTIVGANDVEAKCCAALAEALGVADAMTVVGRVPGDEMYAYLQDNDVGICLWEDRPYWRFNPPTKLFEYLVAGLPVVANDIRTHTKYVRDGVNGRICRYDSQSLAEKLEQLYEDRDSLAEMARSARGEGSKFIWSAVEPAFLSGLGGSE